jgi:hypothetical protein
MAEVLVRFTGRIVAEDGTAYLPQACGGIADDGLWEGWIEFISESGTALRSPRETEQPNRDALVYWAEGLGVAYLEGALGRTLAAHLVSVPVVERVPSIFSGSASSRPIAEPAPRAILDPFSAYAEGEELLRRQLAALSRDHLVNIIKAYRLPVDAAHESLSDQALVDSIMTAVRRVAG